LDLDGWMFDVLRGWLDLNRRHPWKTLISIHRSATPTEP
jgi:hypothetical protein